MGAIQESLPRWEVGLRAIAMTVLCVGARPTAAAITVALTPCFIWQMRRVRVPASGCFVVLATVLGVALTVSRGGSVLIAVFTVGVAVQGVGLGAMESVDRARVCQLYSTLVLALSLFWVAAHKDEVAATWSSSGLVGWAGHKNLFGYALALALVPCVWPPMLGDRPLRARLTTIVKTAALAVLIVGTRSSGALAVSVVVLAVAVIVRRARPRSSTLTAGRLAFLVMAVALVLVNLTQTIELFGREPTITGRTEVWSAVSSRLGDYTFIGDGPGTNWRGWSVGGRDGRPTSLTQSVWDAAGLHVTSSHNSGLELAIVFGVPIALALLLLFVRSLVLAARSQIGGRTVVLGSWVASAMVAESFATTPLILLVLACVISTTSRCEMHPFR